MTIGVQNILTGRLMNRRSALKIQRRMNWSRPMLSQFPRLNVLRPAVGWVRSVFFGTAIMTLGTLAASPVAAQTDPLCTQGMTNASGQVLKFYRVVNRHPYTLEIRQFNDGVLATRFRLGPGKSHDVTYGQTTTVTLRWQEQGVTTERSQGMTWWSGNHCYPLQPTVTNAQTKPRRAVPSTPPVPVRKYGDPIPPMGDQTVLNPCQTLYSDGTVRTRGGFDCSTDKTGTRGQANADPARRRKVPADPPYIVRRYGDPIPATGDKRVLKRCQYLYSDGIIRTRGATGCSPQMGQPIQLLPSPTLTQTRSTPSPAPNPPPTRLVQPIPKPNFDTPICQNQRRRPQPQAIAASADTGRAPIGPGQSLVVKKRYLTDGDFYSIALGSDGNIVVNDAKTGNYESSIYEEPDAKGFGNRVKSAEMGTNGVLALRDGKGDILYSVPKSGAVRGSSLTATPLGKLAIIAPDGRYVWPKDTSESTKGINISTYGSRCPAEGDGRPYIDTSEFVGFGDVWQLEPVQ
ncbi:hypothetical protein [Thalassovita litoralis]|nr:hypothetical protein [Thalassovita litoralis]